MGQDSDKHSLADVKSGNKLQIDSAKDATRIVLKNALKNDYDSEEFKTILKQEIFPLSKDRYGNVTTILGGSEEQYNTTILGGSEEKYNSK